MNGKPPADGGRDDCPSSEPKPCANKLPGAAGWCTKPPGHEPPCKGEPLHPIDTHTLDHLKRQ